MTVEYVSRREFDDLRAMVTRNGQRMDWLDEHGTRGVGSLQLQVTELAKDVAKVEAAQEAHVIAHQAESRERRDQVRSTTRWYIGLMAGIVGSGLADFIAILALHSH